MMLLAEVASRPLIQFTLAPLFEDHGLPLAVMGIVVVFAALVLINVFITLLPRLVARTTAGAMEQLAAKTPFPEDELSEETLVAIVAAVAATISKPHRIVKIRGLTNEDLAWAREGRMLHHQSHRIQPKDR